MLVSSRSASQNSPRSAFACFLLFAACTPLDGSGSEPNDASGDGTMVNQSDAQSSTDASAEAGQADTRPSAPADAGSTASDAANQPKDTGPDERTELDAASASDAAPNLSNDATQDAEPQGPSDAAQDAATQGPSDAAQDAGSTSDTGSPVIDHCASSPCAHGACTSGATTFTCACSGPWVGTRCDTAMFQALGTLPGLTESEARSVNSNGSVVVGVARRVAPATGFAPLQWKAITGLVQLPSTGSASAEAVSGDGLIVVGSESGSPTAAVRWIGGARGSNYAAPLVNNMTSGAHALVVNTDGTVAAGIGEYTNEYPKAVRWVASSGQIERIDPSGHEESYARGISGDGKVVVGYTYTPDTAFVWRAGDVRLNALPTLDASRGSLALGISQNGNVIVGSSGGQAVRWVNGAAPISLGLAGTAYGANADGSVIVGRTGTAFVWRSGASPQFQLLSDVLLTAGVNLSGWTLEQASAVSADGSTVVGHGTHNGVREGFIARLR
jgi:uncharacterized membrane protein